MLFLIFSIILWIAVYIFVGERFYKLWKPGLIGLGIMWTADYFGTKYNLYTYPIGLFYIGSIPVFHFTQVYASAILYLNWLPVSWSKKVLYTIYAAALILALEAFSHRLGYISYPNWKLSYSYFLILGGLLLLAYLSDRLNKIIKKPALKTGHK